MDPVLKPLKAAADPSRLRILRILRGGPFNVAELTDILGLGQSTVSRHLKVLSEAGLVSVRRAGTWAYYSIHAKADDGFGERLLDLLEERLRRGANGDSGAVDRVLARRRRATSDFFRETASTWDTVRDRALGPPAHLGRLLEIVGRGGTIVDLGTGTGVLLERLDPTAQHVIGVDASPEMLEVAGRRVEEAELDRTELRLGTLEHLPLSDGEADTMVANLVLHHVADPPVVFREITRGLAPGGRLVIADLAEHGDESFWRSLGARWPGFRPGEVREWLAAAGFSDVRTESGPEPPAGDSPDPAAPPRVFLVEARRSD